MKKSNSSFVFEGCSHNLTVEEDDELRRMRWSAIGSKKKLMPYWNGSTPRQYFTDDFQNMFTHSTLSKEELKPFRDHQNMLAGLDFVVALESDVLGHTFVEWTF
ncbi:hypothetical protein Vadar_017987 [Vaccinium darrowii]|uniref:Uncharacterized protein n=1 Tax=Vaccinium darrowii TaxID=229202 RepID=A0ACB7ZDH2_9ERIC|nr:hypothetical protein Vadar_017987 [Vaccinium darrowii]